MADILTSQVTIRPDIARVIDGYPPATRNGVLRLRALIHSVADRARAGSIEETLKWGQPSLTPAQGGGTPLRIGPHQDAAFALFAHCQTRVIADFAAAFPGWDRLDGNRAVLFDSIDQIEPERLSHLMRHALTYHRVAANVR